MNRLCTFVLALGAACLSTAGQAAKPGKCSPQLLAPSGLTVESDGSTVTSTWNEVNDLSNEATKYSVEITAHYDAHGDVKFTFTAFDDDPGELDTASLTIDASGLDTMVCNDPPGCLSNTTHSATSVTVQVKGLNPPSKGKEQSQCNPFSAPVTTILGPLATCDCISADELATIAANGTGAYDQCVARYDNLPISIDWGVGAGNTAAGLSDRTPYGGSDRICYVNLLGFVDDVNVTAAEFAACVSLIEAAQATVGCDTCIGADCPP